MQILQVENLVKHYGNGANLVKALDGVSLKIQKGEFVSIVGKSGSGKSTLLHLIGGLENASAGNVIIDDKEISGLEDENSANFAEERLALYFRAIICCQY